MSNLNVRWAHVEDVALIAPLFDGYRQFYEKPSDLDFCTEFLTARLTAADSRVAMAIDAAGVVLGFMQLYPLFSSLALSMDATRVWLLNDLFVSPAARGLGVGVALLDFAQKFAQDSGAGYLMLETAKSNLIAQGLYEKQGWMRDNEFLVYQWRVN